MACNPGVLVKKSTINPIANPLKIRKNGFILGGKKIKKPK